MAGRRERIRQHAEHVAAQDEQEERQDEGEVLLAGTAHIVVDHLGDELVADLGHGLQPARHQRPLAHAVDEEEQHDRDSDRHPERGIGVGDVEPAEMQRQQPLDLELLHRIVHCALVPRSFCPPTCRHPARRPWHTP